MFRPQVLNRSGEDHRLWQRPSGVSEVNNILFADGRVEASVFIVGVIPFLGLHSAGALPFLPLFIPSAPGGQGRVTVPLSIVSPPP